MTIVESLIDKVFASGGLTGLILLLMVGLVFYMAFSLNKVTLSLLSALKKSLYEEDHEFKALKKAAYEYQVLPDRRHHNREVVDSEQEH